MGNGVNLVVVAGELAYDPDIRTSKKGMTATFVIPIDEFWTDPNTGTSHKRTEWIRIVAFNKNAQQAAAYLRKGSSVHVQGSHRTDNYRDKNTGAMVPRTQVMCRVLEFMGRHSDESAPITEPVVTADAGDTIASVRDQTNKVVPSKGYELPGYCQWFSPSVNAIQNADYCVGSYRYSHKVA